MYSALGIFSAVLMAKIALQKSSLAVLVTYFITRAMPMHYIDGENHKSETEKQQQLFNQSYEVQNTPLVINGLRGGHTHIKTNACLRESVFKKPGTSQLASGLKIQSEKPTIQYSIHTVHNMYTHFDLGSEVSHALYQLLIVLLYHPAPLVHVDME